MKESHRLAATERIGSGKGGARKLRAAGSCPAVLYGPGTDPMPLQIDSVELRKFLHSAGESSLMDLEISGREGGAVSTAKVIIRDVQYRPMVDTPAHVDFYRVSLDRLLTIAVPVGMTGSCEAVENKTGSISQQTHEISVECLPTEIPGSIEADISSLEVGGSIHAKDLPMPPGVSLAGNPDLAIVTINAIKAVEEAEEEAEAGVELESAEPEVIGQEKGQEAETRES